MADFETTEPTELVRREEVLRYLPDLPIDHWDLHRFCNLQCRHYKRTRAVRSQYRSCNSGLDTLRRWLWSWPREFFSCMLMIGP